MAFFWSSAYLRSASASILSITCTCRSEASFPNFSFNSWRLKRDSNSNWYIACWYSSSVVNRWRWDHLICASFSFCAFSNNFSSAWYCLFKSLSSDSAPCLPAVRPFPEGNWLTNCTNFFFSPSSALSSTALSCASWSNPRINARFARSSISVRASIVAFCSW